MHTIQNIKSQPTVGKFLGKFVYSLFESMVERLLSLDNLPNTCKCSSDSMLQAIFNYKGVGIPMEGEMLLTLKTLRNKCPRFSA